MPEQWEKRGHVFVPDKKIFQKARKNNLLLDKAWQCYACVVKGIKPDLKSALNYEKELENLCTEEEE